MDVNSGQECHQGASRLSGKANLLKVFFYGPGGKLQIESVCLHKTGQAGTHPWAMLTLVHFIVSSWSLVFLLNIYHAHLAAAEIAFTITIDIRLIMFTQR